jgi:hypothetical protein
MKLTPNFPAKTQGMDSFVQISRWREGELDQCLAKFTHFAVKRIFCQALELEARLYLEKHKDLVDERGKRLVVRNGRSKNKRLVMGGDICELSIPRVNDRRPGHRFQSRVLAPYLKRLNVDGNLFPLLWRDNITFKDFYFVLKSIIGSSISMFSDEDIIHLKGRWVDELKEFLQDEGKKGDITTIWCDGTHYPDISRFNAGAHLRVLVLMGQKIRGEKKILAIKVVRENTEEGWLDLVKSIKEQISNKIEKIMLGDGAGDLIYGVLGAPMVAQDGVISCPRSQLLMGLSQLVQKEPRHLQMQMQHQLRQVEFPPEEPKTISENEKAGVP